MAISQARLFTALQECHYIECATRKQYFHFKHDYRSAYLRLLGPNEDYKMKEVRHFVSQLHLTDGQKQILRHHIPEL